jgi:cation/acetate symporter
LVKIDGQSGADASTGPVNPVEFLALLDDPDTQYQRWSSVSFSDSEGNSIKDFYAFLTPGNRVLRPGLKFKVEGTFFERLDFASLMLALFLGTAALPHVLIRYYTVPNRAAVRKSTIVAIAAIGFFYILTLFMGLGAMTSAVVNPLDNNMSAPLLARSFSEFLFAVISAIAFATVLGTVSGLIIAASGAVAHDLLDRFAQVKMTETTKVRAGKIAAIGVGVVAIILGILFQGMNVSFLVGLAFSVAASANLPAIVMILFWKKTTAKGVTASIAVGILAAVGLILLSPEMFARYGLDPVSAPIPFNNPGIISIPLSFITLVGVSLISPKKASTPQS